MVLLNASGPRLRLFLQHLKSSSHLCHTLRHSAALGLQLRTITSRLFLLCAALLVNVVDSRVLESRARLSSCGCLSPCTSVTLGHPESGRGKTASDEKPLCTPCCGCNNLHLRFYSLKLRLVESKFRGPCAKSYMTATITLQMTLQVPLGENLSTR